MKLKRVFLRLALITGIVFIIGKPGISEADTLTVCPAGPPTCDYSSIQDAIDDATSGDTVEVRAGTYNENITMKDGVDVVNYSTDVPVIDADGTNPAVTFDDAFSTGCTLDGFEIKDGGTNGGIYLHGTGAGIDNITTIQDCDIHGNSGPGIKLDGGTALTAPTIDNNDIRNNSQGGIYAINAGSSSEDLVIKNNSIYDHDTYGKAGINIGGDSYVTIGNDNHIYDNKPGIAFDTGDPNTEPVTIIDNHIEDNDDGGICQIDAITGKVTITENDIELNEKGGIGIHDSCELEITKNKIHDNHRGGIHTGTDVADGGGFSGSMGDAILTIRQNKVYNNGESNYGGGIDVRHASGTIENNLVYENHRGGIRFGWENETDDHITAIKNNTVVSNGENSLGGGIIYDDLAGAVNAQPEGALPGQLVIRNNISAYNETAGLRVGNMPSGNTACPDNDDYDSGKYRDYNLLYSNNGTGADDCGYPDSLIMSCVNQNFGGCGGIWNPDPPPYVILEAPNNIIGDPLFTNIGGHDYTLQGSSPAKNAGDDGEDMGAYGGSYPIDW
jgi:hypothetical protein